jgi:hypothetical protein
MPTPKRPKPWSLDEALFVEVEIAHPRKHQMHLFFQNGTRLVITNDSQLPLAAELIISKFANHLPIHRQQHIFQRLGLHDPRDTLNHWTLESLELLRPIAEAIRHDYLSKTYLQVDETPIKQLPEKPAPATSGPSTTLVLTAASASVG